MTAPEQPPPQPWPNQRPVVDGVEEVSQDPDLFAGEDEDAEGGDDRMGED